MDKKTQDIAILVELFRASGWDEMHVEIDGVQLFLSTDPNARLNGGNTLPRMPDVPVPSSLLPADGATLGVARPGTAALPAVASTPAAAEVPSHWIGVTAPNLGTFYRAPKPGVAPFVEVGQLVEASTDVCLLEVMKLFTTVKAGAKGTIRRVCVNDADMVEFGQTLFYVDPS
jgi:acetyl-CoA carboxylase biotin carboxyl carrier protein